jgi:hypothetical protein
MTTLSKHFCDAMIARYKMEETPTRRRLENRDWEPLTKFSIVSIGRGDPFWPMAYQALALEQLTDVAEARIHHWLPDDLAIEHVDNIHPGYDTLVVRLDNLGPSRLKVRGKLVEEPKGYIHLLREGTPHEIITGPTARYSFVAWVK